MTAAQSPLWTEPSLLDRWPVGTRVRSTLTTNVGQVVAHDPERVRLSIRWEKWLPRDPRPFECWHSNDQWLEREVQA